MGKFRIALRFSEWIDGPKDDPYDLCLHGYVDVQIGDEQFADYGAVSATALYLLKSLTEDHVPSPSEIKMIPCCGHFMVISPDRCNIEVVGCGNGTDWTILHSGADVCLITTSGHEITVSFEEYRREVFSFADSVKAVYDRCSPKRADENGEGEEYRTFWKEWQRRRESI